MSNPMNERDKARISARLAYIMELVLVQAEQLEKSLLEIAELSERLGVSTDSIASVSKTASVIGSFKQLKEV